MSATFGRRNLPQAATAGFSRDPAAIRRADAPAPQPTPGAAASAPRAGLGWRLILAIIAFPVFWFGIIAYQGPSLLRDYRLASSFHNDFTVKVVKANCTAYWFVLKTCSVDYQILDARPSDIQTTNFMVAFTGTDGKVVAPLRSTIDRNAITTQIALDLMTNRIITFLSLVIGMLALMITIVRKLWRASRDEDADGVVSPTQG